MAALAGSRTEANLRRAFTMATLACRRHDAAADSAEAESGRHAAALFRAIAKSRASQAEGHLNWVEPCAGNTRTAYDVRLAIMNELDALGGSYPAMARAARREGFDEIADWFEVLAKASRSHAGRFRRALETLL